MATPMGPPLLPSFSLRVKVYPPNTHSSNAKPLRAFRVVTAPEATVQQFCHEASKIYEASYGEPLVIKRCQDAEEFDINQTQILGTLFANCDTIRVIQATTGPGMRDSVPPTSALRFDPANQISGKRNREGMTRSYSSPSSASSPSKRQRIANLDPDQAIPSREGDLNVGSAAEEEEESPKIRIPNSQVEATVGRIIADSRYGRDERRISETPSPQTPDLATFRVGPDARFGQKSDNQSSNIFPISHTRILSPVGSASSHARKSPGSKSLGCHIQIANERDMSGSDAATSPLPGDQQSAATNGTRSTNECRVSDNVLETPRMNGKPTSNPSIEKIYGNLPSDDKAPKILRRAASNLKIQKSSLSTLRGLNLIEKKLKTPPNESWRISHSQDRIISTWELSKERGERRQNEANEVNRGIRAAAETEGTRRGESIEIQAAEDWETVQREQRERAAEEMRNATIARATRLEKEHMERQERRRKRAEQREAEESLQEQRRICEEAEAVDRVQREKHSRMAKERQQRQEREKLEEEEAIEKEKQQAVRLVSKKEWAENANRMEGDAKRPAKDTVLAVEAARNSTKLSEQSKTSTADRSRAKISPPQSSSTAFIPPRRKSAPKTLSPQEKRSSSPELARSVSAVTSKATRAHLTPIETKRKLSFLEFPQEVNNEFSKQSSRTNTPIAVNTFEEAPKDLPKPGPIRTPILPPSRNLTSEPTVKLPTPKQGPMRTPISPPSRNLTTRPTIKSPTIHPLKQHNTTNILPPTKRSRKQRSMTPHRQLTGETKPAATEAPLPIAKGISIAAQSALRDDVSTILISSEGPTRSGSPSPPLPSCKASDDEGAGEEYKGEEKEAEEDDSDVPSRMDLIQVLNSSVRFLNSAKSELEPVSQDEIRDENVGMQDGQSDRSASRSPIMFSLRTTTKDTETSQSAESAFPSSNDEDEPLDVNKSDKVEEESEENEEDELVTATAARSSPPSSSAAKSMVSSPSGGNSFHLTSSMFQASSVGTQNKPDLIPASGTARPTFRVGASLASMNAEKRFLYSSASNAQRRAQPLKPPNLPDFDDEDEEESEDDSNLDSEDDQRPPTNKLPEPQTSRSSHAHRSSSDSESESGSVEDDNIAHQNDLAAQIAKITRLQASSQIHDTTILNLVNGSQVSMGSGRTRKKIGSGGNKGTHLRYQSV